MIFKIFICKDNLYADAPSNIELKNGNEDDPNEVLLLPFFTFRVAHIEETRNKLTVSLRDHNDKEAKNELGRIATGARSIMGIKADKNGQLWYVDAESNTVVRIDQN